MNKTHILTWSEFTDTLFLFIPFYFFVFLPPCLPLFFPLFNFFLQCYQYHVSLATCKLLRGVFSGFQINLVDFPSTLDSLWRIIKMGRPQTFLNLLREITSRQFFTGILVFGMVPHKLPCCHLTFHSVMPKVLLKDALDN